MWTGIKTYSHQFIWDELVSIQAILRTLGTQVLTHTHVHTRDVTPSCCSQINRFHRSITTVTVESSPLYMHKWVLILKKTQWNTQIQLYRWFAKMLIPMHVHIVVA